jgi:hypothetical protein
MNLEGIKDGEITIHIPLKEAADALAALKKLHDELGEEAHALEAALEQAGVEPPAPEDHRRYEYMPPADGH